MTEDRPSPQSGQKVMRDFGRMGIVIDYLGGAMPFPVKLFQSGTRRDGG